MISDAKYGKNGVLLTANPANAGPKSNTLGNVNASQCVNGNGNVMPKLLVNQYQPIKSIINYGQTCTNANINQHLSNFANLSISSGSKADYANVNGLNSNTMSSNIINNTSSTSSNNGSGKKYCSKTLASSSSSSTNSSTSSTGSVNVKFSGFFKDKIDEREKYLTAKYPNHQMALIKKRLKVEFWIDEQLKSLFNINDDNSKEDYDICADDLVDNLLDMDTDNERKYFILNQLTKAKRGKEEIMKFVDELLVKLRML